MNIDLVIPYVDSLDLNWQKLFYQYNPLKGESVEGINATNRFRGQGDFFKYWFRCVDKNMPWIRKIHLIVQSDSQVPKWIDRDKVHIVLHKDIIPEEYLPTFNSTCIEMFLWKIEDLTEYFIYSNDDFFAVGPLQPQYFFNFEEGKVKNNLSNGFQNKPSMTMYQHHCLNGYSLVSGKEEDKVPLCFHLMRPYIKSNMIEAFESNKEELLNRISRFREITNINVYYFNYYLVKSGLQEPRKEIVNRVVDSKMFYRDVYAIITTIGLNMLAIQDTSSILDIYKSSTIINWFSNRFNFKSKYEV